MKRSGDAAVFTLIFLGSTCAPPPAGDAGTPRILVFTKTAGFRHTSIEAGIRAFEHLASDMHLATDVTEDAAAFTTENLARYGAVVFLSTTGDVLNATQQGHFVSFIQSGGGYLGIHAASDTEYDWPWYGRLAGGYFNGHPDIRMASVLAADASHPAAQGLPAPWIRTDEWYEIRDLNPDVTVVLRLDEQSYKRPDENPLAEPRPIAWFHEYDGGRAFYTALGHTIESWSDPLFLAHVRGGLESVLPARPESPS